MGEIFDMGLRAWRRDRAARTGPELFLLERAFADCLERLAILDRRFDRALLIGCPDPDWPRRLGAIADTIEAADPGSLFAQRAGGARFDDDAITLAPTRYDLILTIGTLDTVNGVQPALRGFRQALRPDGLLLGAMSGGETLPLLRRLAAAADRVSGGAAPRVHPRIEPAMLAPLLEQAGFVRPVVDIDRAEVRYRSLDRLVGDLRAMAATNILRERSRTPFGKAARRAMIEAFDAEAVDGRATETFEILHFAAWTPSPPA